MERAQLLWNVRNSYETCATSMIYISSQTLQKALNDTIPIYIYYIQVSELLKFTHIYIVIVWVCSLISVAELAPSWRREDVKKNWDTDTFQKNIVFFCLHGHMGIVFLGQRFIFLSYFFLNGRG